MSSNTPAFESTRPTEADVLVVGRGIAGLFTALRAAEHSSVALVTKSVLEEGNTRYAQGGIAAALFDDDSIDAHITDTISAGAGLCDETAVRVLCSEGPDRVRELIELGVAFDRTGDTLSRGREAAHSTARVLHAGGDATGAIIEGALADAVRKSATFISVHSTLVDVIVDGGRARGARFVDGVGKHFEIRSPAVVLATGGAGHVYAHTTNPPVATGDGVVAAFRSGAVIRDAEMYQFHPTALDLPGNPFLVSEAVRGEGAVLRDANGNEFMSEVHPMGDLAPRDIVARAIAAQVARQDGKSVVLDATMLPATFLEERFPGIHAQCLARGIDWTATPLPVTPAAHYWMGGAATDTHGRTNVPGLYAIGEVACTGVHGANRLASNSLLEGIVFGHRAASTIAAGSDSWPTFEATALPVVASAGTEVDASELQQMMWDNVGLLRDEQGLEIAHKQLGAWTSSDPSTFTMLATSRLIVAGAIARRESRGAHVRSDFPVTNPAFDRHIGWAPC